MARGKNLLLRPLTCCTSKASVALVTFPKLAVMAAKAGMSHTSRSRLLKLTMCILFGISMLLLVRLCRTLSVTLLPR